MPEALTVNNNNNEQFEAALKEVYGADVEQRQIYSDHMISVFLVETKDDFELVRLFKIGGKAKISVDAKFTKGDYLVTTAEVAAFVLKNYPPLIRSYYITGDAHY